MNMKPAPTKPIIPLCEHLFSHDRRCGSPAMRGMHFCYYHRQNRRLRGFEVIPDLTSRHNIQRALSNVLRGVFTGRIPFDEAGRIINGISLAMQSMKSVAPGSGRRSLRSTMPAMKTSILLVVIASLAFAQPGSQKTGGKSPLTAIPSSKLPQRHEVMRNRKVIVSTAVLKPGETMPMHRHEHDLVTVILTAGQLRETLQDEGTVKSGGKKVGRIFGAMHIPGATGDKVQAGDVQFREAGATHANENRGKNVLRATTVEFLERAGQQKDPAKKSNKYCNPNDKKICVEEKYLFCTEKFCVEDVTMNAGAVSTKHSHATDHMLVAVTDYELTDTAAGKPKKIRRKKSGEVEYISSGITHQLKNTGKSDARFIVLAFQ